MVLEQIATLAERKSMNKNFKTKIKNLKETPSFAFVLKNYPEIVIKIK